MSDEDKKVDVELASLGPAAGDDRHLDAGTKEAGSTEVVNSIEEPEILRGMTASEKLELEKRMRRKIDLRLLPMIVVLYILNYIDRNNISAAALAGLREDLELEGSQFQTAVSILFVGYVLMQVPSNMLLNKTGRPAIYLPCFVIVWGVISAATAAVTSFGGLLAVRFCLGLVEAAYYPGCLYYLSCWYKRDELSFRTTILYMGALISGAFSGLISAGITSGMDGVLGWRPWRWLFLIEGTVTVAVALIAFVVLPNFPRTTRWLTEEERAMAVWRLQVDIGTDDWKDSESQMGLQGLKMALSDPKTYMLLVILFCIAAAGSITSFFPIVVKTLQFDNVKTLLLTTPPYVLTTILALLNSWHSDKTGERFWHIVLPFCVGIIAYILGASTTSTAARYTSIMLMLPGIYGGYTIALAWISSTLPRPAAKRTVALAFINACANTAQIYVSFLYLDGMAPRFVGAFVHNALMLLVAGIAAVVLRFTLVRLNKKLDRGEYVEGAVNEGGFRFML